MTGNCSGRRKEIFHVVIFVGGFVVTRDQLRVFCGSFDVPAAKGYNEDPLKCANDILESDPGNLFTVTPYGTTVYNNKTLKTYLIVHGVSVAFNESEVNDAREEVTMPGERLFECWYEDFPFDVINANKEHFDYKQFPVQFTTFQWPSIHAVHLPAIIDVIVTVECLERWLGMQKAQESGSDEAFGQPFMAVFNEEDEADLDQHKLHGSEDDQVEEGSDGDSLS